MISAMEKQATNRTLLSKLGDYYLVPHELLHVLAYRLIGKPCHYELGDRQVQGQAEKTRGERLFVLLLPFAVSFGLGLFFHALGFLALFWVGWQYPFSIAATPQAYLAIIPKWPFALTLLASFFIIYSGTAYGDIWNVFRILFERKEPANQPHHQP